MCRVLVLQGVEWGLREGIHGFVILFYDKLSPSRAEPEGKAGKEGTQEEKGWFELGEELA